VALLECRSDKCQVIFPISPRPPKEIQKKIICDNSTKVQIMYMRPQGSAWKQRKGKELKVVKRSADRRRKKYSKGNNKIIKKQGD